MNNIDSLSDSESREVVKRKDSIREDGNEDQHSSPSKTVEALKGNDIELRKANLVDFKSEEMVKVLNTDNNGEKVFGLERKPLPFESNKVMEGAKNELSGENSIKSCFHPEPQEALRRESKSMQLNSSRFELEEAIDGRDPDHEDKENIHLTVPLASNSTSRTGAYAINAEAAAVVDARIAKKRRESIEPINEKPALEDGVCALVGNDTKCLSTNNITTTSIGTDVTQLNEDLATRISDLRRESVPKVAKSGVRCELNALDARIRAKSRGTRENLRASLKKQQSSTSMSLSQLEQDALIKQRTFSSSSTTPGAITEDSRVQRTGVKMCLSSSFTSLCQLELDDLAEQHTVSDSSAILDGIADDSRMQRAGVKMCRSSSSTSLGQLEQGVIDKGCTFSFSSTTPGAISVDGPMKRGSINIRRYSTSASLRQLERGVLDKEGTVSVAATTPGAISEDSSMRRGSVKMRRCSSSTTISQLEQDVLAKECTISLASTPGAISEGGRGLDIIKNADKTDQTVVSTPEDSNSAPGPSAIVSQGIVNGPDLYFGSGPNGDSPLAVAIAVSQEGNDFIPAAVQYKPGAKPPIYKNRRFRFYAFTATVILVAIGVCIALVLTSKQSTGANDPTIAPTTVRENMGIAEQFIHIVGESNLELGGSPHNQATNWILHEDPLQLQSDAENLSQRYLLALLYFSTTERRPWRTCNAPIGDETSECIFEDLIKIEPEDVYLQKDSFRWLSERHECDWAGVYCDEFNQTRAIDLKGQDILSTFPTELAMMPYVQSLTFSHNEFYGTIPSELANMKHLLNIELHYNYFTGEIPHEYYKVYSPQRINFAGNLLTGTIPTEVGLLTTLKGFFVQENDLTGTLPTEIGNMKFLTFTRWSRNLWTGTVPSEIGKLEKAQELWLHRTNLEGTLPTELGNMKKMNDLRLHFNSFSGPIPEEHFNMTMLTRWDLYNCNFTGTISSKIQRMRSLQTYRIRGNQFYGTIPAELGRLWFLNELWLHKNDLTGEIPEEVCSLRGPRGITSLEADCGIADIDENPKIDCMLGCCTVCCDGKGFCGVNEL